MPIWIVVATVLVTLFVVVVAMNLHTPSKFARQMAAVFEQDLGLSAPYTLQRWRNRSWKQRVAEVVVVPITAQLQENL